jgi:L-alanine-DL-glutamate epimerase-like enolase superfamily enzyme
MKITDIKVTLFCWENIPDTKYVQGVGAFGGVSQLGLVEITTDAGIVGRSFLGSAARGAHFDAQSLVDTLKPVLIGQDALDRERLYRAMWKRNRNTTLRAIGAVDVALWDIGGIAASLPIHRLIGTYRTQVKAYASSALLPTPEAYVDEALALKSKGWGAYKIHPPTRWKDDIAVATAVRKAVGDDYTLMLDSTWSYDLREAMEVGRAIEEMDYYWFEDPLGEDDILNYVQLRQKLDIPVVATEYSWGSLEAYVPWITLGATSALRGDVAVKGGITPCLKAAHLAEAFNMNFELHHGGNSVNNWANLHLAASIRNTGMFEVLLPDGSQKYAVVGDLEIDDRGYIQVPGNVGLGVEIDHALIARNTIAVVK